ncbi:23S rRNA pseudouridine(1911/1915/1917) synthase RluD [Cellvibrio japonicus]|uniref:Pseudouridine synthase n=1 Tax=Cellvibrio japonicus (strain Ueda107) TaxID=498211 RepID=B3PE02_CELJU|nr:23S rRNA pseudouridine(1911/1915/1917) synthase RluD [Cellvibrio japonicus]ACE84622.1 pseudouridine synthase, RluA family subfamily [Cellvibrio japonicus Ueda107]QEI13485.1 23S rRNA pseudouridine(1911/1915/1917) synthase RluD [Cellvibrio japonicus]QEI17059.1 23S rRNA pseudouridine(1911/1915/1917) synthase RluD [Cellvibrio japonicus]QEI20637.1 23S rRNA pseudouridine(1911/1915/1917) synthase RluD [Cellvibrio japonicus]
MKDVVELSAQVPIQMNGMRFDQAASELFPDFSRSRLQGWIKDGLLTVDGRVAKPKDKLIGGETLALHAELEAQGDWEPEAIELDIIHEDDDLLIINKQAGLVVHPAAGNYTGTLVNALLNHAPSLVNIPRAGIVHRLDKDTTGLMVVAKTLEAHTDLVAQLADRSVSREYEAVAVGAMTGGGTVDAPIGRHPLQRKLMAVLSQGGKRAVTHYRVAKRYPHHTHIRVKLETGRTHQIRVHMAHVGHPLVGDQTYGNRFKIPKGANQQLIEALKHFPRQALHAFKLGLEHPGTGEYTEWTAPLPADFRKLLDALDQGYQQED